MELRSKVSKKQEKLLTEDLGKITEYALCLVLKIPFESNFKYSIEEAEKIKERIKEIKSLLQDLKYKHTGKSSKLYDFTLEDSIETSKNISVKTNKNKNCDKICPQLIGQPTKKKFCEFFKLPEKSSDEKIKNFIVENISKILVDYFKYCFHCILLYYNKEDDVVMLIQDSKNIDWEKLTLKFTHLENKKSWNESTTLFFVKEEKKITLGEFQVHNNRSNIKFRFNLKNLLKHFPENFKVDSI